MDKQNVTTTETSTHDEVNSSDNSNAVKDPHDWATGDEPMTGAQKSYLKTLSDQAGEAFDDTITKAAGFDENRRVAGKDRTRQRVDGADYFEQAEPLRGLRLFLFSPQIATDEADGGGV